MKTGSKGGKNTTSGPLFNPFDPLFHVDPYPTYQRLRIEDPVHWSLLNTWVLTRYADVKLVLRDPRFLVDPIPKNIESKSQYLEHLQQDLTTLSGAISNFLFFLDPPQHTRLRALVGKVFSVNAFERIYPEIPGIVQQLLEEVRHRGTMDIIADFAEQLPVIVIARLLGVPSEDQEQLHIWSKALARTLDPLIPLQAYAQLNTVAEDFLSYFHQLIQQRRQRPQEDLITAFLAVQEAGEKLTENELLSICMLMFSTGEETTVNTIGNGMLALLEKPEQREILRENPHLINSALEELMRYNSPVQMTTRIARETLQIEDKTIQAGDKIVTVLGAANRDPNVFTHPDSLNLKRENNYHVAFGDGIHHCLGAKLARIQSQIAINALVQQLSHIELAVEQVEWRGNIVLRGLKSLPVTFESF